MAPAHKKSKPNSEQQQQQTQQPGDQSSRSPTQSADATPPSKVPRDESSHPSVTRGEQIPKTSVTRPSSWYSGGSWRSKASPVAQIARESISVAQGTTTEASEEASRRPSQSVSKRMRNSSRKSIPLAAEATRVHATSDVGDKSRPRFPSEEKLKGIDGTEEVKNQGDVETEYVGTAHEGKAVVAEPAPLPPPPTTDSNADAKSVLSADSATARIQSGAWFGWWSRPDGYGSDGERLKDQKQKQDVEEASNTPLPGTPKDEPVEPAAMEGTSMATDQNASKSLGLGNAAQWEGLQPEMSTIANASRSWFGLWSSAQNQQAQAEAQAKKEAEPTSTLTAPPVITVSTEPVATEQATKLDTATKESRSQQQSEERPKSSGWAFWSSDKPIEDTPIPGGTQKEIGELAVADTPSQSHPEAAQFNEQRDQQKTNKTDMKRANSLLKPKARNEEKSKGSSGESSSAATTPAESTAHTPSISQVPTPVDTPPLEDSDAPTPVKRGKSTQKRPSLILPSFHDTYPPAPNPSYIDRFSQYLAQTLRLAGTQAPSAPQHVYISPTPPRIKKAIAIGVHGFFPAHLIQKVLGQPTGTSIRFANYAAASIKAWCQGHQPEIKGVEVEKVALEGEGVIADRVTILWKLLLNWLSHLRQADFILVACHSQGVPVAFMLIAKLIQLGCLSPHVRFGVCAMAGINLGPFIEYKSRFFGGSALELFDFCDSGSKVSKTYAEALDICLRHNVRVTFIGSLDDQLVSLESSLHAPLSHPYISRAVFIDGKVHAPNFLTHLVVFALKLRNLGISDHGLLRELSAPLAGSLVGGEGHSRVYDDPAVYRLAVDFALESTDAPIITPANHVTTPTASNSLLSHDKDLASRTAAARRASLSGYPASAAHANSIRRGSISASANLPGIAPLMAEYEAPAGGAAANPFYLPWAVRGMLEEETVKREPKMQNEVADLVKEFEDWKPTSKVLRDVRWRLEGVRSMI